MFKIHRLFFLICCCFCVLTLGAQDCYKTFYEQGVQAYEAHNFDVATKKFKAARACRNLSPEQEKELTKWIEDSNTGAMRKIKSSMLTMLSVQQLEQKNDATRAFRYAQYAIQQDANVDAQRAFYKSYFQQVNIPSLKLYKTLGKHQNGVRILKTSNDGAFILSADDASVKIWTKEGKIVEEYASDKWKVYDLSLHPNGGSFLMACSDGFLRTRKVGLGNKDYLEKIKIATEGTARSAQWSPDGDYFVGAGADGHNQIFDAKGKLIKEIKDANGGFTAIYFQADGDYFIGNVFSFESNRYFLYQRDGTLVKELTAPGTAITDACFAPTGNNILTSDEKGGVQIFKTDGTLLRQVNHGSYVKRVAFGPDGRFFLSVGAASDLTVKTWTLEGEPIGNLSHSADIMQSYFLSNGLVVTTTFDGSVKIWSPQGMLLGSMNGHQQAVISATYLHVERLLFTGSMDGSVLVWNLNENDIPLLTGHLHGINTIDISPDGQFILSTSHDGTSRLWDDGGNFRVKLEQQERGVFVTQGLFSSDGKHILTASTDQTIRLFKADIQNISNPPVEIRREAALEGKPTFSPDGQHILAAYSDGQVIVWDLAGKPVLTLKHDFPVKLATYSPNGQHILSYEAEPPAMDGSTVQHNLCLFDKKGQRLNTLKGHTMPINTIQFSPDGRHIISGANDSTVRLWDFKGEVAELQNGSPCNIARWSPDGRFIYGASAYEFSLSQWDAQGKFLQKIPAHIAHFQSLQFSPDGQYLLTTSSDKQGKLWTADGQEIVSVSGFALPGMFDYISAGAVSPRGDYFVTASTTGGIRIWPLGVERLLENVKKMGIDDLSKEEKQKHGIE